jgi:carotenoid cleavage dioxygenase-like enzyme
MVHGVHLEGVRATCRPPYLRCGVLSADGNKVITVTACRIENPVARAVMPRRVPVGFHAHWAAAN